MLMKSEEEPGLRMGGLLDSADVDVARVEVDAEGPAVRDPLRPAWQPDHALPLPVCLTERLPL